MNKKISRFFLQAIFLAYAVGGAVILLINLISRTDYTYKKTFLLPGIVLLPIGLLLILGICFLTGRLRMEKPRIRRASLLLFLTQGYIAFNIYFVSQTWDAWTLIKNARLIAEGVTEGLSNSYFSAFPNNHLTVWLYSLLYKLNNAFGIFDTDNGLLLIILLQCLLSTLTGLILFHVIRDLTSSCRYAWIGWGIYVILIGLSGWNIVTYTDILSLIFPISILRIYQLTNNGHRIGFKWFSILLLTYWGYKIKPTVLIVLIAILAIELLHQISDFTLKAHLKMILLVLLLSAGSIGISHVIIQKGVASTGLQIDPEGDTGPLHMVMMGLNSKTDGAWYSKDVSLSRGIESKKERTAAQIAEIKARLSRYGLKGLLWHLRRKSLLIFNDGTFAWGVEGGFYELVFPDKNTVAAPFLKNLYYNDGKYYPYLAALEHMTWLAIFMLSLGLIFVKKDKTTAVLSLSLIGIILFNFIFEARARYILIYVPFWITGAMMVCQKILQRFIKSN